MIDADQMDFSRTAPGFLSIGIDIYLEKFLLNQLLVRHTVILYFPLCWTLESKCWCFVLWMVKWAKLIKTWPRDKTHLSIIAPFACLRKFWQINQILRQQFHECKRVSKLTLKIPSSWVAMRYAAIVQFNILQGLVKNHFKTRFPAKGRVPLPNRMNFWKNSKRPLTPPLIFGKLCCKFFIMDMVAYMQGGMRAR